MLSSPGSSTPTSISTSHWHLHSVGIVPTNHLARHKLVKELGYKQPNNRHSANEHVLEPQQQGGFHQQTLEKLWLKLNPIYFPLVSMFAKYMSILHHLKLEILEVCPKHPLDQRLWSSLFTYRYKVVPQFGIAKLVNIIPITMVMVDLSILSKLFLCFK